MFRGAQTQFIHGALRDKYMIPEIHETKTTKRHMFWGAQTQFIHGALKNKKQLDSGILQKRTIDCENQVITTWGHARCACAVRMIHARARRRARTLNKLLV